MLEAKEETEIMSAYCLSEVHRALRGTQGRIEVNETNTFITVIDPGATWALLREKETQA